MTISRKDVENNQSDLIEVGELRLNTVTHHVTLAEKAIYLTPKAVILLKVLMINHGEVLTRERLLHEIWDWAGNNHFDTRVVDLRINEIRRKLGCNPKQPRFIETVFGQGYRFVTK